MTARLPAVAVAALAAACTLPPATPPLAPPAADPPPPAEEAPARERQTLVLPEDALERDGTEPTAAIGREALPSPDHLVGLGGGDLVALLGPPDFRRQDHPAQVWRYRDAACVLDVFLYARGSGALRVAHVEARGHSVVHVPARRCLDSLLRTRNGGPAG